jgi:hypothetical protein
LSAGHGPRKSVGFGGINPYRLLPGQAKELVTKAERNSREERRIMSKIELGKLAKREDEDRGSSYSKVFYTKAFPAFFARHRILRLNVTRRRALDRCARELES